MTATGALRRLVEEKSAELGYRPGEMIDDHIAIAEHVTNRLRDALIVACCEAGIALPDGVYCNDVEAKGYTSTGQDFTGETETRATRKGRALVVETLAPTPPLHETPERS